jgi:hypothetical protein
MLESRNFLRYCTYCLPICSPAGTKTCLFIAVSHVERTRLDGLDLSPLEGFDLFAVGACRGMPAECCRQKRVGHAWIAVVRAVSHDKDAPRAPAELAKLDPLWNSTRNRQRWREDP